MGDFIAVCGIDCEACPAFIATAKGDLGALAKLAEDWGRQFGFSAKAEEMRCKGCHAADGVQIGHCSHCAVRLCALGKGHATCAACADFGCKTLSDFIAEMPEARQRLETLRAGSQ
jgi:hypothetical protein